MFQMNGVSNVKAEVRITGEQSKANHADDFNLRLLPDPDPAKVLMLFTFSLRFSSLNIFFSFLFSSLLL